MHRSEAQFCRVEAERLLNLARQTTDPNVREDLTRMASEWVQRAKAKEVSAVTLGTERPLTPLIYTSAPRAKRRRVFPR